MDLKKLREKNGMTQAYVAHVLGISINHISKLENSKRKPSLDVINKLAELYGVESVEIFLIINSTISGK